MRHGRRRVDANQPLIVATLRAAGAVVVPIYALGHGCPDLLVCYDGVVHLLEIKAEAGDKLTADEAGWHGRWGAAGGRVAVVRTPVEALRAVGVRRDEEVPV